ncbi:bacteriohemerythrin [Staphylothermus hellenicus]|nr:hemerythrin family protein [Staphylothermus hellenicus]
MSLYDLVVDNIVDIIHNIDLEKLKLLLEQEFIDEYKSNNCAEDLYNDIMKRGNGIFLYSIRDSIFLELLVYNGVITNIGPGKLEINEKEDVKNMLRSLNNPCIITVYRVKQPTYRFINKYLCGIKIMDQLHIEMFGLMDNLILAIIRGDLKNLKNLAEKLYEHTEKKHFKTEEDLMLQTKYNKHYKEDYKIHITWHKDFLKIISEIKKNAEKKDYISLLENLLMIFHTYFDKYLEEADAKLAKYLKSLGNIS